MSSSGICNKRVFQSGAYAAGRQQGSEKVLWLHSYYRGGVVFQCVEQFRQRVRLWRRIHLAPAEVNSERCTSFLADKTRESHSHAVCRSSDEAQASFPLPEKQATHGEGLCKQESSDRLRFPFSRWATTHHTARLAGHPYRTPVLHVRIIMYSCVPVPGTTVWILRYP